MTQQQPLSSDDIEAAVARAREYRAATIRAAAVSLNLILRRFLSSRQPQLAMPRPTRLQAAASAKA